MAYSSVSATTGAVIEAATTNQIQDNFDAILDGSKSFEQVTFSDTTATLGLHTESGVLKFKDDNVIGGGLVYRDIYAGAFDFPTSVPSALDSINYPSGNIDYKRLRFDDTTAEGGLYTLALPDNIDTSVNPTINMYGAAVTVGTDKDVVYYIDYRIYGDGDDFSNPSVTGQALSGAKRCDNTQDELDLFSWVFDGADFTADKSFMHIKLIRDASHGSDNLVGDYGVFLLRLGFTTEG